MKDAAYHKFAALRAHAATKSRAACAMLAELDEAIDRELGNYLQNALAYLVH